MANTQLRGRGHTIRYGAMPMNPDLLDNPPFAAPSSRFNFDNPTPEETARQQEIAEAIQKKDLLADVPLCALSQGLGIPIPKIRRYRRVIAFLEYGEKPDNDTMRRALRERAGDGLLRVNADERKTVAELTEADVSRIYRNVRNGDRGFLNSFYPSYPEYAPK